MSITKDEYDKERQAFMARRAEINHELEGHHAGDDQFKIALTSLVTLASRSWDIFQRSTIAEKRKLIGFVFSNLELKGATLCYDLKKPFDLFVNLAENNAWRPVVDTLRTQYRRDVLVLIKILPSFRGIGAAA